MTKLLEKAMEEAARLPAPAQETIATRILEEIASEARWDAQFAQSQQALKRLADEALAEFDAGKTLPFVNDSDLSHD